MQTDEDPQMPFGTDQDDTIDEAAMDDLFRMGPTFGRREYQLTCLGLSMTSRLFLFFDILLITRIVSLVLWSSSVLGFLGFITLTHLSFRFSSGGLATYMCRGLGLCAC